MTWIDTNGTFTNDLATFQATADYATVTSMVFGGTGLLTSLTGLSGLPTLATLDCNTNALTTLDLTGCGALTSLYCYSCGITGTLDVSPCTALTILYCADNVMLTAGVDGTLAALVTANLTGAGTADLSGTNQSPTLGVNNVDKLLLELPANGWTVTVTP